jgi:hypothetical protein
MMRQLLLLLPLCAQFAFGSTTAIVSFTNDRTAGHGNYDVAGWEFTTSSTINISDLGLWVSGESLADTHNIGVFSTSGVLQFSGVVNAGATPDAKGFTWVNVGSNTLAAGDWVIAAQYNAGSSDLMFDGHGSITMASGLTFDQAWVWFSSSPQTFTSPGPGLFKEGLPRDSYIGPNFEFTASPEPTTWTLMLLPALAILRRRKK